MNLVSKKTEKISITVHYVEKTNKYGVTLYEVVNDEKAKELLADPKTADTVKSISTKWAKPTWAGQQKLYGDADVPDPVTGKKSTDWSLFSDLQLKGSLLSWDIQGEDGRELPVDPDLIDNLPPSIANALLTEYRLSTLPDEATTGN